MIYSGSLSPTQLAQHIAVTRGISISSGTTGILFCEGTKILFLQLGCNAVSSVPNIRHGGTPSKTGLIFSEKSVMLEGVQAIILY